MFRHLGLSGQVLHIFWRCKFTQYEIGLWCNIYNDHNIPVEGTGNTIGKKTPVKKQTLDLKIRNAKDRLRNKSLVGQNSGN
jgi:hypothetical protein